MHIDFLEAIKDATDAASQNLDQVKYWLFWYENGQLAIDRDEHNRFVEALRSPEDFRGFIIEQEQEHQAIVDAHTQALSTGADQAELRELDAMVHQKSQELQILDQISRLHKEVFDLLGFNRAQDVFTSLKMQRYARSNAFRSACTSVNEKVDCVDGMIIRYEGVPYPNKKILVQDKTIPLARVFQRRFLDPARHSKPSAPEVLFKATFHEDFADPEDEVTFEFPPSSPLSSQEWVPMQELFQGGFPPEGSWEAKAIALIQKEFRHKIVAASSDSLRNVVDHLITELDHIPARQGGINYACQGKYWSLVMFIKVFLGWEELRFASPQENGNIRRRCSFKINPVQGKTVFDKVAVNDIQESARVELPGKMSMITAKMLDFQSRMEKGEAVEASEWSSLNTEALRLKTRVDAFSQELGRDKGLLDVGLKTWETVYARFTGADGD